jgi:hypothetical protein
MKVTEEWTVQQLRRSISMGQRTSVKVKLGRLPHVEEGQPVISPAREIELGKARSTEQGPSRPATLRFTLT